MLAIAFTQLSSYYTLTLIPWFHGSIHIFTTIYFWIVFKVGKIEKSRNM